MNDPKISLLSMEKCVIIPPSVAAWVYAISVHGGCCVFGGIPCGIVLYLITKKKYSEKTKVFIGSFVAIVAAASVFVGRPIIESYSPNNEITFIGPFLASTFGFTTFFKSLNVAFGTYPIGADTDLQTWIHWFVMTPEPSFAKGKASKANRKEIIARTRDFFFKIIALFFLLTVMMQLSPPFYQVLPYEVNGGNNSFGGDTLDWFLAAHVNGFLHLWLLYSFASFCEDFSTITNYILSGGVRMEPGFCNPLLESRSFKETWGTRWNKPVNELLKRTVYIPACKSGFFNQNQSAVLTFFASGLLHEYNFAMHNHRSLSLPSGYQPGEVTVFFLFMGILMIGESWVWNKLYPRWLQSLISSLPSAVTATMLTFLVAALSERYFLRGWLQSGFVEAVAQMLPHLDCQ